MLKSNYLKLVPTLREELGLKSVSMVPRIVKVVINVGIGKAEQSSKASEMVIPELVKISGQKPVITKAKKSIAGFKLREGMPVGVMVTLRGNRMYDFLDRLVNVALARVRDFQGLDPKVGFDCSGFITYVFNHFKIIVPRSSIDFTNVGRTIPADSAKAGDLVLFTGTDSTEKFVGHMGLIVSNQDKLMQFIHSTSGKKYGVTITPMSDYYRGRYVKTIRIFPQNE